jgi:AcrB/AcrD/AcrF family
VRLSLQADLPPEQLYDLANEVIKPRFEQVADVGGVRILGGARREIQIELDRNQLNSYKIPMVRISNQIRNTGLNVPVGKFEAGATEISFRTLGQFETVEQIANTVISFGADIGSGVTLRKLGAVRDTTEDLKTLTYLYAPTGESPKPNHLKQMFGFSGDTPQVERSLRTALFIDVYKQSGSNTVAVVDGALARLAKINEDMKGQPGAPRLVVVRDGSLWIRYNIDHPRHHTRGDRRVLLSGKCALYNHHRSCAAQLAARRVSADVRHGLHDERDDPAGAVAHHRPVGGRCNRRPRKHLPKNRRRPESARSGRAGHKRSYACRHRDDVDRDCSVFADWLSNGNRRPVFQRIRPDGRICDADQPL